MLEKIKSAKNIHVVGISGTEGSAVAIFLKKLGINFTAHDFAEKLRFKRGFLKNHFGYSAIKRGKMLKSILDLKNLKFEENYLQGIEKADLIFVSQNWEAYSPNQKLKNIFQRSPNRFATITQLYFQLFPGKIIAVTGTNGKSTTAKLISEIMMSTGQQVDKLKASSRQALDKNKSVSWFTGNDRRNIQILDCLDKWTKKDWLTIEVSNRQLKFPLGRSPDIGVILNVTPNHLSEYSGSFLDYENGKFSLIKNQTKDQVAVLNNDNLSTRRFAKRVDSAPILYSTQKNLSTGACLKKGWVVDSINLSTGQSVEKKICLLDKICLLGSHNLSNVLAAVAATRAAGVKASVIRKVLERFCGIPQRLELVYQKNGVKFVNDSASTTPESTIAAMKSFEQGSVNLIAGGESKGMNYKTLIQEIKLQKTRVVLLESPLARILNKPLKKEGVAFEVVKTLQEAVRISLKNAKVGDCVLLSPAAAWFCYFEGKIPLGGKGFEKFSKILA